MIYYSSKGHNTREYIVVKHQLPGINTSILGIRYVDGFGVVAKNSKEHVRLKQIRMAVAEELPITYLKKVKSVINNMQVKVIWGNSVYAYYMEKLAAKEENPIQAKATERPFCKNHHEGKQCGNQALEGFTMCRKHIENDPLLEEKIKEIRFLPKEEKKHYIDALIDEVRSK